MDSVLDIDGKEIEIECFHPGQFLKEEIEARKILKREVSYKLQIMPHHLSEIFSGKRNISATIAVRLEKILEIKADYWLRLQMNYDLYIARKEL